MEHIAIISTDLIYPVISIAVTGLSLYFGLATYNLRNVLRRDPGFCEFLKYIAIQQFGGYSMFLISSRLLLNFLKISFLYHGVFYIGIALYLLCILFLTEIINCVFKRIKFQTSFEFHMLIFFPNFTSTCYKKCNILSEFHFYRKLELVYGLVMSIIALTLFRTRTYIFKHYFTIQCLSSEKLEIMHIAGWCSSTALGIAILLIITEILCIVYFGISFLDWAFIEVCSDNETPEANDDCKDTNFNRADKRRNTV